MKKTFKLLTLTLLSMLVAVSAFAQVTTSSMSGRVTEKDGTPVAGATVIATHTPSGTKYYATTDSYGNYRIPNMRVGGPYDVEASLLGYGEIKTSNAHLRLGENFVRNLVMNEEAVALDAITITAGVNPLLNSDKNGASTNVSSAQLRQLPSISRGITDFTKLTPQSNGTSFGGRDNRMNTVTIDGAVFNNNFGLSTSQILPGGQAQPIALDAIEEVTVNLAPFDIRQSQFTGASINAVTKSGNNRFSGSLYTYLRPKSFTGNKVGENIVAGAHDSKAQTYGITLGGPIVKDKLFFFISGEYETSVSPSGAWEPSTDGKSNSATKTSRTTVADLEKMYNFLKSTYNYDAGAYQNFPNFNRKNHKILARLDWNINKNNKFTVRYNEVVGTYDVLTNSNSAPGSRGSGRSSAQSVAFSNAWYGFENTVRSITAELNSTWGKVSNNFLASYTMIEDKRTSNSDIFPFVDIYKGGDQYMAFGYELFTYNNDVKNNTLSIKDNLSFSVNNHNITLGASYDQLYFANAYMREGTSYYRYDYNGTKDPATGITYADGMEAFYAGATPTAFAIQYAYNEGEVPAVELSFGMASLYAQDEWQANERLKVTYGLRAEMPIYLNSLETNAEVDAFYFNKWNNKWRDHYKVGVPAEANYSIQSGKWPKSRIQLSPRIGFNWDVKGDRSVQLRGGTGLFTGFLPFVWFTNQPNGSGMVQSPEVTITNVNTLATNGIKFNPNFRDQIKNNPTLLPTTPGKLPNNPALAEVDKDFRMPQVWRTNLAVDIKLPWNMVLTLEEIFTKDINAVMQKNINMEYPTAFYKGSDRRPYWGTQKINGTVGSAMLLTNTSKGYQNSLTVQLTRNMSRGFSGSLAYTYTIAKDITSNPGSTAASAWSSNPVISYLNDPELSYSNFAVPHRLVGNLSYRFEWLGHLATTFSLMYTGQAQGRCNWMYSNDMNKDGYTADLMYIPRSATDIKFADYTYKWTDPSTKVTHNVTVPASQAQATFWNYVENNKFLRKHKGQYAHRFEYIAPWHNRWDFKVMQDIFTNFGGNRRYTLQASLDIINVGNLLNKNWGAYKSMGSQSYDNLRPLTFVRAEGGEPLFRLNANATANDVQSVIDNFIDQNTWKKTASTSSTWGMLLGLRLIF
ncbi:MAG: TonB-dependent receptor [Bacteroidales bacterium]|nr:TonB-dependent receptor [Bacteroidales bacterium]